MSNTRIQAAAEILSTPDREISPLERMQGMASAWMNATPEARAHALAASQASSMEEADLMIETRTRQPISNRANDLLAAYVAIEREQHRLAEAGFEKEADALGEPALEVQRKILAIRDRTGNPDLIAARVMVELMICHNWQKLEAGKGIVWSHEEREIALPLLEAVADQTTGTVREHVTKALATIGVDVPSEAPDPLRKLVQEFRDGLAAINAVPDDDDDAADALDREKLSPLFSILTTTPPAPTTTAGAAEAIRLVRDQNSGGSYCPDMIRSVLTVVADALDGQAVMPHVDGLHKCGKFSPLAATGLLPIAQLIAITDAAYRNRMAHLDEISRAERMMSKGSSERQYIERTDSALCHLYNEGLRAVIRAPVSTIEEARAKATFLLRPQFEIADLILGDDEATLLGLLRSLTVEPQPPA